MCINLIFFSINAYVNRRKRTILFNYYSRVDVKMKVAIVFCTLTIAASLTSSLADDEEFYNEELCANQGGNCIKKDECPIDILDEYVGLCPEQQSQGAECCHGISIREHRCRKLGGECFADNCYQETHQIHQATDCPSDEVCCLLF